MANALRSISITVLGVYGFLSQASGSGYEVPIDRDAQVLACGEIASEGYAHQSANNMLEGTPEQHALVKKGGLDLAIKALKTWPDDKEVVLACMGAIGGMTLFNRPIGLLAAKKGALELCLNGNTQWPDDAEMSQWGTMGCFFDAVDENRERFAKLGGIQKMHESIRHFTKHKKPQAVLQGWFGFSSVCGGFVTAPICTDVGIIETGVKSMMDPALAEGRVREEVCQCFRALQTYYPASRVLLAQAGAADAYVSALQAGQTDSQLVSVVCANMALFAGGLLPFDLDFNETQRDMLVQAGAIGAVTDLLVAAGSLTVRSGGAGQNEGYFPLPDCLQVVRLLAHNSEVNRKALVKLGTLEAVTSIMENNPNDQSILSKGREAVQSLEALPSIMEKNPDNQYLRSMGSNAVKSLKVGGKIMRHALGHENLAVSFYVDPDAQINRNP